MTDFRSKIINFVNKNRAKVKSALTVVTFGIKVPAGLFIPSMVTGAISGMKSFFKCYSKNGQSVENRFCSKLVRNSNRRKKLILTKK